MNEELRQFAEAAKNPFDYDWLTYSWVCMVAAWGGLVKFLNAIRDRKETIKQTMLTLVTGLVTSTFVGVLTFWLCELGKFEPLTTAICVAATGHMGSEALVALNRFAMSRLKAAWIAFTAPAKQNED